ncbi:hypothetical protein [Burkholderia sp. 22PA0106]|uniref:hypothetical protein n=1 Tax=Burkholderia sp. 22PA0106 TaxID=3237371 RepID=UPI0039C3B34C
MIRLRHLLAQRLTHPAAASLLLLVVVFRLLLPPGLMLAPSIGGRGVDLSICSGHGALFGDAPTLGGNGNGSRSADPAAQAAEADLAKALAGSPPHPAPHANTQHAGDLCPFSAALAIGLAPTLPLPAYWLRLATGARRPFPADEAPPSASPVHGSLGARAPPLVTRH